MNAEQFGFFNHQLAGMLKGGVPLEGALRQLTSRMRQGSLRTEIETLERDLSSGTPLPEAIERRDLPGFYRRMVAVGVHGGDLPEVLRQVADHYDRIGAVSMRLRSLMTYPVIVLAVMTVLTLGMTWVWAGAGSSEIAAAVADLTEGWFSPGPAGRSDLASDVLVRLVAPPAIAVVLLAVAIAFTTVPAMRGWLRWRAPGFRDGSLAQSASLLAALTGSGCDLGTALALMRDLEDGTPACRELEAMHARLEGGSRRFSDLAEGLQLYGGTFRWLVDSAGENLQAGLVRAAAFYQRRARYRIETVLYAVLPVSVVFLGAILALQASGLVQILKTMLGMVTSIGY